MHRPHELQSGKIYGRWPGDEVWAMAKAAAEGDVPTLRSLLQRDPTLVQSEYAYTRPIHLAVREGRLEAASLLLESGADPASVTLEGDDLLTTARDREDADMARLLERELAPRTGPGRDLERGSRPGGDTALHRAVAKGDRREVERLLAKGADLGAVHGPGPGTAEGYAPEGFEPIDLALWDGPHWGIRGDSEMARLLLEHGASLDSVIAAALGELD
ncbi:MAG: ankyrin repeat domain-containing protein, partial [Holophagales bacterium]|nr:ankyrin repeat domain-containing protein [Holophagales bacterium]